MMKLYYSPGACSLSPHIVLSEAGLRFELEKVDLGAHRTEHGTDYFTINPKGYVPALELSNGQILTEGAAIVQYLADLVPEKELAPPAGMLERYRLQEWLNYIATEIHKGFGPLFNPRAHEDVKAAAKAQLEKRLGYVAESLSGKNFLMGDAFSVADAYLFTVLRWSGYVKLDLSSWPVLKEFLTRVAARPAVAAAMKAEGL